jgi:imidazole glycerol-phosphate synthase subunit HisH
MHHVIAIVDAGLGNVGSVANMLLHLGILAQVVSKPEQLAGSTHLVLPGVGAFDNGMRRLEDTGFRHVLDGMVATGVPVLGICLGFQLMGRRSDEGHLQGLGWLEAETRAFDAASVASSGLRLPHVGWNEVSVLREDPVLGSDSSRFYFVHGYHVVCDHADDVVATARHGQTFTAAARRGRILGVQFHPEKSHRHGMGLFRRFVGMTS